MKRRKSHVTNEGIIEKVSNDITLQEKFSAIMNDAQSADADAAKEKLTAFTKYTGYDVTLEEMAKKDEGELADIELDMVAGGKGSVGKSFTWLFKKAEREAGQFVDDPIRWLF